MIKQIYFSDSYVDKIECKLPAGVRPRILTGLPGITKIFKYGGKGIEPVETLNVVLDDEEMSIFNQVFEMFNKLSAIGLMCMIYLEKPWISAGTPSRGKVINKQVLKDYFLTRVE